MKRPSLFWRGLMRMERHLPATGWAADRPSGEARRLTRGQMIGFSLVVILPALRSVFLHPRDIGEAWPTWRPMFLDLLLVCAAALIVAAVGAGIVAWLRAERGAHA